MGAASRKRRFSLLARSLLLLGLAAGLRLTHNRPAIVADPDPLSATTPTPERVQEVATRLREHVDALAGPGSRSWREPERLRAAAGYIETFWSALGYGVERQAIPGLGADYVNLIASPADAPWAGRPYLLGAHYDTVHGTPGADDNASGIAVLFEVSRLIHTEPLKKQSAPVFVAFTLEEPPHFMTPRQGSWVFTRQLARERKQLAGAVILEMVGYYRSEPGSQSFPFPLGFLGYPKTGDFCGVVANRASARLLPGLKAAITGAGLPVETLAVPGKGRLVQPLRFSDHASFWDLGFPAVMVTDTSFYRNPHYHGPDDTPDTLDYEAMARLTLGLASFFE